MPTYSTSSFGVDRRRRLFSSLQPVLPGEQLWQALWLWEIEFAETAPFAVSGYAQRLAEFLGMPGSAQALLDHVTQGIQGPAEQLPADPIDQMVANPFQPTGAGSAPVAASGNSGAVPQQTNVGPPEVVVFNAMVGSLLAGLARKRPGAEGQLKREIAETAGTIVNGVAHTNVVAWSRDQTGIIDGLSTGEMGQLLNAMYVWICEEVGPSSVDRMFGDAVRSADQLPEAARFPPRRLL